MSVTQIMASQRGDLSLVQRSLEIGVDCDAKEKDEVIELVSL